ncbi:MAG: LysR family transcriptional regulator [Candidatus Kerfeldbacteria bacterium]|nr:LysR family transcriptional regulator [Candidatus Kerfeldbacteria bacterium]
MDRRLDQLDFRLLKAFLAIYEHRHLGRAADSMGLSQPTMSTQLAKLRQIFSDALFIRGAQGMQPTRRGSELAEPIRAALTALETAITARQKFEPTQSRRKFIVYMSDLGQGTVLRRLVSRIERSAPNVWINVVTQWDDTLADRLDDGTIDIAYGWIPQLKGRKASVLLFKETFIGLRHMAQSSSRRSRDNDKPMPRYALAGLPGTAHQSVLERFIRHGIEPLLTVPNLSILPDAIASSGLTAIVTTHLAHSIVAKPDSNYMIVDPPFRLPVLSIRMHWSSRTYRDEGIDWLRGEMMACVNEYLEARRGWRKMVPEIQAAR